MVDPQRDVEQYLDDAARARVPDRPRVPDPLPRRLRRRAPRAARARGRAHPPRRRGRGGVPVHADGRRRRPCSSARSVSTVLETPGHSPESISILVYDPARRDDEPVRGADRRHAVHRRRRSPRPARRARVERRGARRACSTTRCTTSWCRCPTRRSSTRRTAPARCAARTSAARPCRRSGSSARYNYALQPMSRERFIEIVTADQPDTPAYFTYDAVLNAREHPTLEQALERELRPLTLERDARARGDRGAAARHPRAGRSSRVRTCGAASTSAWAAATRPGAARCSTPSARSC